MPKTRFEVRSSWRRSPLTSQVIRRSPGVGEGVGGDDDRSDRSVGVPGLAEVEMGGGGRELQRPVRDVLADGESTHVAPRVLWADVSSPVADHDHELCFVVIGASAEDDRVIWAGQAAGELREDERRLGKSMSDSSA